MNSGLTLTQTDNLTDYLLLCAEERHKKYKHVAYKFFPDIRSMECVIYWGVFSWAIPSQGERWLRKNTIVTLGKFPSTPGDIVRGYLDFYHPQKLRAIAKEAQTFERQASAPLYITPTIIPNAMYIDVSATYFSIVKLVGWNVTFLNGKWLTAGRAPLDFPLPQDKAARNYLVSVGLKTPMLIWNGYRLVQKSARNVHTNRALWELVQAILHSIANSAVYLGSRYVHTDGYILPKSNAEVLLKEIASWGLTGRIVAEGNAIIVGFGNYMIGEKRTKHFDPSQRASEPFSNLQSTRHSAWLKAQVNDIRQRGIPERLFERSLRL